MKKYLPIAIVAMSVFGLGSLTSCHDEDFDVSPAVLQDHAFEQAFFKEFGKPSENQSWDFYSQKLQSLRQGAGLTRATMAVTPPNYDIEQPKDDEYFKKIVEEIGYALEEGHDNSDTGQNGYDLVSSGDFKIYAVRYAGDIQIYDSYEFEIGYIDEVNNQMVKLFETGFRDGYEPTEELTNPNRPWNATTNPYKYGNPGWAAEVYIPEGTMFHFYLKCHTENEDRIFYSNQKPPSYTYRYRDYNWQPWTYVTLGYESYGGCSTLLYSAERIDAEAGLDEQVMMIGFEDAWGLSRGPDYDFNDVVLLIEGKLPLPTSKRFFCEDKKSFDWDYNDVVFDVMSTGIVLRAVGGEQPVFLRVTDRNGDTKIYGELHELMLQEQFADNNKVKTVTYKRMKDGEEKTFYKSIDVAAYEITGFEEHSVWLDPVQIALWENLGGQSTHQRLSKQEVDNFSVVVNDTYKGKVELIVLDEYATSYDKNAMLNATSYPDFGPLDPDSDIITEGGYKLISLSPAGDVPAMFIAPVSTKWVKELQKITLGYNNFYGKVVDSTNADGDPIQLYWYETAVNNDNLYVFLGDAPD